MFKAISVQALFSIALLFVVLVFAEGCSCDGDARGIAGVGDKCDDANICNEDTHCVEGRCVAWGEGEYDPECVRGTVNGAVKPRLQCTWSAPSTSDSARKYTRVLGTTVVANLGITTTQGVPTRPSIVFVALNSETSTWEDGVLRVIDGANCKDLGAATSASANPAADERVVGSVTPAIGDLNGDGKPDVVAAATLGGLIAFTWSPEQNKLVKLWHSKLASNETDTSTAGLNRWGGISLADLNDDGRPEIVWYGRVWSPDGVLLSSVPGWEQSYNATTEVLPSRAPVIVNIDADAAIELVSSEGIWQWNSTTNTFDVERSFGGAVGWTAVADFGEWPNSMGAGVPELVHVVEGHIWLQSLTGQILRDHIASTFSTLAPRGGAPTVADYDGDGQPEIGAAFAEEYVVYDPIENKELWRSASEDQSSRMTGSSVFDFNGDGRAEAVYGDECFVRVYDGATGDVQFSQARSSETWNENPVIADVDGDFAAEIVVGSSSACGETSGAIDSCGLGTAAFDPLYKGVRCDAASDCLSNSCIEGFCRCSDNNQCDKGYGCTAALAGTPGSGNVCRAHRNDCKSGISIFRDAQDQWSSARQMWNQHAYFITNINDDGTIARSSQMKVNWTTLGLNNFRQNVPGIIGPRPAADLTVQADLYACGTKLSAKVCNRGAALADADVPIVFYAEEGKVKICEARTTVPIAPGECVTSSCTPQMSYNYSKINVTVDPEDFFVECENRNNTINEDTVDCAIAF